MLNQDELLKSLIDNAWLLSDLDLVNVDQDSSLKELVDLVTVDKDVEHPLKHLPQEITSEHIIRIMRDPEYFPFTCKVLFNIEILPFQHLILKELWNKPFPMLIGSRGLGKCISEHTLVVTNSGFDSFKNIMADVHIPQTKYYTKNFKLLGENDFCDVEYKWMNEESETLKIKTKFGFELEPTLNHPLRVVRDGEIKWVETGDVLIGDIVPIERSEKWFPDTNDLPEDLAYLFGCLVGDGGYTQRGSIGFTSADSELVEELSKITIKYWGKPINKRKAKYEYAICGNNIWDELFQKYGFNSPVCEKKGFPASVLSSKKEVMAAFLRGLFDTDGTALKNFSCVEFASKSKDLAKMVQFVLLRYGILSKFRPRYNKKYKTTYYYIYMFGKEAQKFGREIGFGLKRKMDVLNSHSLKKSNTNIDTIPLCLVRKQLDQLKLDILEKYGPAKKNSGIIPARKVISEYKLKMHGLTYDKLKTILDATSELSDKQSWLDLKKIYDQNYYYDEIVKLEKSRSITYDVYIPDDHSFISNGFISHNSFILAVYAMLRLTFTQGCKVAIIGAAFRQSKVIFEYMEKLWADGPILRDLCGSGKGRGGREQGPRRDIDRCEMIIGDSVAIALPLGNGEKIRGQRANYIIADEYASISEEIYQNVVRGFASVSADPASLVKHKAKIKVLKKLNLWTEENEKEEIKNMRSNQNIISGTANYSFNHFYKTWKTYKSFIESRGNKEKLQEIFDGPVPNGFDWRDFSIMRIPVDLLPLGFMDEKQISSAKATLSKSNYSIEFGATFATDSDGFFKRSLIESCTVGKPGLPVKDGDGNDILFASDLIGDDNVCHVIAVDPASEKDNFCVIIIALYNGYRGVVHCWTTTRAAFKARLKHNIVKEENFYAFCARKIRDLMSAFPNVVRIVLDSQGGGFAIEEALQDRSKLREEEQPIWQIVDDNKEKDSDNKQGLHILQMVNFADSKWTVEANHGMRKDMEDKILLFPYFDSAAVGLAYEEDKASGRLITDEDDEIKLYDTLEDCMMEIEDMKNELASIVHSETASGRERWDVPSVKLPGSKAGRQRKDRYSALLMANMGARQIQRIDAPPEYTPRGGFANAVKYNDTEEMYTGPAWFVNAVKNIDYGASVARDGVELFDPST